MGGYIRGGDNFPSTTGLISPLEQNKIPAGVFARSQQAASPVWHLSVRGKGSPPGLAGTDLRQVER